MILKNAENMQDFLPREPDNSGWLNIDVVEGQMF